MKKLFGGRRPSASLVVSIGALILALAGTSLALPGRNKVNSGDIKPGAVKRSDQAASQQTMYAHVQANGDIVAQSGGISMVDDNGAGNYHLRFPRDVGKRPIAATIKSGNGNNGMAAAIRCGSAPIGEVCTGNLSSRHVYVNTRETNGNAGDEPFIVTVLPG